MAGFDTQGMEQAIKAYIAAIFLGGVLTGGMLIGVIHLLLKWFGG